MKITERTIASFQARVIQPGIQKYFENTKYGRKLSWFYNKYCGRRCFFIGNGPSLRADDLTILHRQGDISFAFNRIYNIFEETLWRPTFYIAQDEKMLSGCAEIVDRLELPTKFIPIQLHWYYNINIHDAVYFNMNWQQAEAAKDYLFSDNVPHELYCANTGMYTAAQLAAYMGFEKIYFIGVDHHFQISQNNEGKIVIDNAVKDYFSDKYNEDKGKLYVPNTEKSTITYVAMKRHCNQRGISVYNATRGGKLEVFPRVDFDELFYR